MDISEHKDSFEGLNQTLRNISPCIRKRHIDPDIQLEIVSDSRSRTGNFHSTKVRGKNPPVHYKSNAYIRYNRSGTHYDKGNLKSIINIRS